MSNRTIVDIDTPDPWIIYSQTHKRFFFTFTLGDRIEIWSSFYLEDWRQCQKSLIWKPQPLAGGDSSPPPWSADVWAPELHVVNGRWYIYFTAGQPNQGNASHRVLILSGPEHDQDPMDPSSWKFRGQLKGLPDHWAIDATVFSLPRSKQPVKRFSADQTPLRNAVGRDPSHQHIVSDEYDLYCCYSSWPIGDNSDTEQVLFLVQLSAPDTAISDALTVISQPTRPWERADSGKHGVNEGPQYLSLNNNQNHAIVFSANGSWTKDYCLGILWLTNTSDPLKPQSWQKRTCPLLASQGETGGPYGSGHASFLRSPTDESKLYCVYHGTERPDEGWSNRKARVLALQEGDFRMKGETVVCNRMPPVDERQVCGVRRLDDGRGHWPDERLEAKCYQHGQQGGDEDGEDHASGGFLRRLGCC